MQSEKTDDWLSCLHGPFRTQFCDVLNLLSLKELQKYPPPKKSGLPIGHEVRVLRRFLQGQSSQLDASCMSRLYRSFATARQRSMYFAFVLGEALPKSDWCSIIGSDTTESWIDNQLLNEELGGKIACCFRIISVGEDEPQET